MQEQQSTSATAELNRDAELSLTADALDAQKWRALVSCARIRVLGHAGCNPDRPLDTYGKPYDNFAHIGLEMWTRHSGKTEPDALQAFLGFVDKAVATQNETGQTPASAPSNREDAIAKSKRVLAAVDDYHDAPTQDNRTALRKLLMEEFTAAAVSASLLRAPASEASRLTALLERLRERCAETAADCLVAVVEGLEYYGEKAAERIRIIELDVGVREFLAASPASAKQSSGEQALEVYAAEASAIRELLDKYAPKTHGSLQRRLESVISRYLDVA